MSNLCICCSARSIQPTRFSMSNMSDHQEKNELGLRCARCHRLLCCNCIYKLAEAIMPIKNDIHRDYSSFVENVISYSGTCYKTSPDNYIGHCCLIEVKRNEEISVENQLKRKQQIEGRNNCHNTNYGGSFCIPEYQMMVMVNTTSMDVFGIGKELQQNGLLHYVLDEKCAQSLMKKGFYPSNRMPNSWITIKKDIAINLPHVLTETKETVSTIILEQYINCFFLWFQC